MDSLLIFGTFFTATSRIKHSIKMLLVSFSQKWEKWGLKYAIKKKKKKADIEC